MMEIVKMFQQNAIFDCFWIVDVAKITLAQFWIFRSFNWFHSQNKYEDETKSSEKSNVIESKTRQLFCKKQKFY